MADDKYLSIEEASKRLGVSEKTVYKYLRGGQLKGEKNPVGGKWLRIKETDLNTFITGKVAEASVQEGEQSGESEEVKVASIETKLAKEKADKAEWDDKAQEAAIKMQLRQQGFDSIQEAKDDAEVLKKEAERILQDAVAVKAEAEAEREIVDEDKEKVVQAWAKVKAGDEASTARLKKTIESEMNTEYQVGKIEKAKAGLIAIVDYHNAYVIPCRKALLNVSKAIYNWASLLESAKIDCAVLYNYIGKVMKVIDRYQDNMPEEVSLDVVDELTPEVEQEGTKQPE